MINLAYRDIAHSFGKFVTTAVGVGLLIGVVLIMIGVFRGMAHDAMMVSNDLNADIWIVQKNTLGPFAESSRLHEDLKYSLRSLRGVKAAEPLTFQSVQIYPNQKAVRVYVMGYDSRAAIIPYHLREGRPIQSPQSEMIADSKSGLKLGESVSLGRGKYTVVGMTHKTVSSGGDPMIYLDLDEAQELQFQFSNEQIRNDRYRGTTAAANQTVNTFVLSVDEGIDTQKLSDEIKRWKHVEAYTNTEQEAILTKNLIERSAKQIGLFTVILLIVSAVIISLIIYTMTINKIKEIAILKLIGSPNLVIVKMIGQQSVLLGIIAFIAGNLFAHASADIFPKTIVLWYSDAAKLFLVIVMVSILASLTGIRSALKVDPSTAIGG